MIPKFRAWDKRFSEFVEDFFVSEDGKIYKKTKDTSYGFAISRETSDKIILMQSTGRFDKNGKEIFEGDVIAIEVDDTGTPINARVFQNSEIGILMFHVFEDDEDVPMVELLEDNSVAFAIIGNIYENKDILEEME